MDFVDGRYDRVTSGIAGNDHARRGGLDFHQAREKFNSIHRRHSIVADHQIKILLIAALDCCFGEVNISKLQCFSVELTDVDHRQAATQRAKNVGLIVDQ